MSKNVLVVEDDANICRLIEVVLRRQSLSPDTVGDGLAAIERLRARPYDVMVLDIMLPKANGFEVAAAAAALATPPQIIVLSAISRYFNDRFPEGSIVLQKPFDLVRLDDVVRSLI